MISRPNIPRGVLDYIYQGRYSLSDAVRLCDSVLKDAATILCRDLLFTHQGWIQSLDLSGIHDNYLNFDDGYSFTHDSLNNFLAYPWIQRSDFDKHYQSASDVNARACFPNSSDFGYNVQSGVTNACPYAIRKYEDNVQRFLEHLIVLILISSGQPDGNCSVGGGSSSDLVSVSCVNRFGIPRHVTVMNGSVYITTPNRFDTLYGFRLLDKQVGNMLALYLICVKPFLKRISCGQLATSDYLFPKGFGHWDAADFATIINRESHRNLNKALDLDDINLTQIRYLHVTNPTALSPDMLDRLNSDFEGIPLPAAPIWDALPSSRMMKMSRTASPDNFVSPTNSVSTSFDSSFSDGSMILQSVSGGSPIKHDSFWGIPSPTLSTASTAYSSTVTPGYEMRLEKEPCMRPLETTRPPVKTLEFIDATPRELATNFRPHGSDLTHTLCFVSIDSSEQLRKKTARATINAASVGPQRRQKGNVQGSAWDRMSKACMSPLQQGLRGRPRKSNTLRGLI